MMLKFFLKSLLVILLTVSNSYAAITYDGTDDSVTCTTDATLDMGNHDQSYYFRYRSTVTAQKDYFTFQAGWKGVGGTGCWMYVYGALEGIACSTSSTGGGGDTTVFGSFVDWNDGEWHTAVLVRDISETDEFIVYMDGAFLFDGDDGNKSSGLVSRTFKIGHSANSIGTLENYFEGDIAEFAVWDRVLTAQEASILHSSGMNGMVIQMATSLNMGLNFTEYADGDSVDANTYRTYGTYPGTCTADNGANDTGLTQESDTEVSF